MKTTRILVPAMVLTAGALLTAQETPGQPPERKPEPPTPAPADTKPAPAPADTTPAPAPATPADTKPAPAPATPADTKPPVTPAAPTTPATPVAPAEAFPTPADVKPLPPTAPASPATQPGTPAPATPVAPAPISPVKPLVEVPPAAPGAPAPAPATPGSLVPTPPTVVQPTPAVPLPAAPAAQPNEPALQQPRSPQFIGAGTINGTRVSARGRATIFSALVFQFHKNEAVNIIEEINVAAPKAGEPRKWYRVQMPHDAGVYVHGQFLSPTFNKTIVDDKGLQITQQFATVRANLLNVRSNAGENFPVVCKLLQDTAVRVSGKSKGKWVEIFAPNNASVFVAAQFVTPAPLNNGVVAIPQPQAGGTAPAPGGATTPGVLPLPPAQPGAQPADTVVKVPIGELTKPNGTSEGGVPIRRNPGAGEGAKPAEPVKPGEGTKPAETVETVKPAEPVKPAPEDPTKPTEVAQPAEAVKPAEGTQPGEGTKPAEQPEAPKVTEVNPNLPPASTEKPGEAPKTLRIVTREGVLKKNLLAPQAPSAYVLKHVETGKVINYLVLNHPVLKLNWYEGSKVLVTGEEAMDARNKKTPVLKIVTIKGEVNKAVLEEIAEAKARPVKPTEPVAAKPETETPQPEAKPEGQPEPAPEPAPEAKPEAQPEETQPDEKPEPQPEGEPKEEKEAPTN